jgi:hypothetical protein
MRIGNWPRRRHCSLSVCCLSKVSRKGVNGRVICIFCFCTVFLLPALFPPRSYL